MPYLWIGFTVLVFGSLLADLYLLHGRNSKPDAKKAGIETLFWVVLGLSFGALLQFLYAKGWADNPLGMSPSRVFTTYLTAYLVELSLSVDNLFVIALIFTSFRIPIHQQPKALFWGILGAIVFRGFMIAAGIALVERFHWMFYLFGLFLLFTALKMLRTKEDEGEDEPIESPKKRFAYVYRYFRITDTPDGDKFFTSLAGKRMATPLFAAVAVIELTDLLFALDSIPAILGITTDPMIVWSSNVFAILGLRSMYFFLAHMLRKFRYLKQSVVAILLFISAKMLSSDFIELPDSFSLIFIGLSLGTGIAVSLLRKDS